MELFYFILAVLLLAVNGRRHTKRQAVIFGSDDTASADNCITPDGAEGSCVRLFECQPLYSKFKEGPSSEFIDFLKRSHCRFERNEPILCCPDVVVVGPPATSVPVTRAPVVLVPKPTVPVTRAPVVLVPKPTVPTSEERDNNPVLPKSCGVTSSDSSRIVGGRIARKGSWPWIAALGYIGIGGRIDFLCGGALIANRHVLTVAHCVHRRFDLNKVRLGAHDLKNDPASSFEDFRISMRIPHENYEPTTFDNDIALLILERPVNFRDSVSPVCLPRGNFFQDNPLTSLQGFIAGWGAVGFNGPSSSVLKEAIVPIRRTEDCRRSFAALKSITIDDRRLCAGSGDADTCQGDSGGPLMIFDPTTTTYSVAGVVSIGYKCAEKEFPGIYTRVTSYMDWIIRNLN